MGHDDTSVVQIFVRYLHLNRRHHSRHCTLLVLFRLMCVRPQFYIHSLIIRWCPRPKKEDCDTKSARQQHARGGNFLPSRRES